MGTKFNCFSTDFVRQNRQFPPKTTMSFTVSSPQPVHGRQPETPPVTDFSDSLGLRHIKRFEPPKNAVKFE